MEDVLHLVRREDQLLSEKLAGVLEEGGCYSCNDCSAPHMRNVWRHRASHHGGEWEGVLWLCQNLKNFNEAHLKMHHFYKEWQRNAGYGVFTDMNCTLYLGYVKL